MDTRLIVRVRIAKRSVGIGPTFRLRQKKFSGPQKPL